MMMAHAAATASDGDGPPGMTCGRSRCRIMSSIPTAPTCKLEVHHRISGVAHAGTPQEVRWGLTRLEHLLVHYQPCLAKVRLVRGLWGPPTE